MREVATKVKDVVGRDVTFAYVGKGNGTATFAVFYADTGVSNGDGTISPPSNWCAVEVPHANVLDFGRVRAAVAGETDIVIDEAELEKQWPVLYQKLLDKSKEDVAAAEAARSADTACAGASGAEFET